MPKGAIPAAALLAMDAANRQAQYLHLQFWVRVDLGSRGAVIRDSACESPQFPPTPARPPSPIGSMASSEPGITSLPLNSPQAQAYRAQQVESAPASDSGFPNSLTQGAPSGVDSQSACPAPGGPHTSLPHAARRDGEGPDQKSKHCCCLALQLRRPWMTPSACLQVQNYF